MRKALFAAVLVPLFPAPATLFAQTQMPSQADNIWARQDDQLAEAEERQSEKAAGIAPSPSHARLKREQRQFWLGRDA